MKKQTSLIVWGKYIFLTQLAMGILTLESDHSFELTDESILLPPNQLHYFVFLNQFEKMWQMITLLKITMGATLFCFVKS